MEEGKKLWYEMFEEIFEELPEEIKIIEEEESHWQW